MLYRLIFASFLLYASPLFAQTDKVDADRENFFRFGGKAGVNGTKIAGTSSSNGFDYNYQLGGFVQLNFSKRFGLQPELSFVQGSTDFTDDGTDIYNDLFGNGSQQKVRFTAVEIPILLNINIGPSKRVKLQVGPALDGILNQVYVGNANIKDVIKNNDWSAIGGLWIQLPFVHVGARYKQGLTNISRPELNLNWKNQTVQFFVGVTF